LGDGAKSYNFLTDRALQFFDQKLWEIKISTLTINSSNEDFAPEFLPTPQIKKISNPKIQILGTKIFNKNKNFSAS